MKNEKVKNVTSLQGGTACPATGGDEAIPIVVRKFLNLQEIASCLAMTNKTKLTIQSINILDRRCAYYRGM